MAGVKARQNQHSFDARKKAQKAREALAARYSGFSMAEFTAQRYVHEMVELLVGIAKDPTVDIQVRRMCANDVIERADGKVTTRVQVQQVDKDDGGKLLEHEAAEAMAEADLLAEAEKWIASQKPVDEWPERVRRRFGPDAMASYMPPIIEIDGQGEVRFDEGPDVYVDEATGGESGRG